MAVTWEKLAYEDDVVTKAFFAAKGDLIGASGDDTPGILSVGTNTHVLTADSGETLGIKWAAASGGVSDSIIKGWIQLNGTGTIAIQDSFNVTSITDNDVGDYTITWDTDFANDDYALSGACEQGHFVAITSASLLVGSVDVRTYHFTGALSDLTYVCVIAIGDQ